MFSSSAIGDQYMRTGHPILGGACILDKVPLVNISMTNMCNIRSDDSVSIRRLSQSYVSNNTFQGIVEVSPRSVRDQGFLTTRVMSWMTSRVKLSDDVDHAATMSRMMSQQIISDDGVSHFNIKSVVLRRDFSVA